jgi:ABC-type nitrate/sulfonate/bicarbonate transport system substrate-binding protein
MTGRFPLPLLLLLSVILGGTVVRANELVRVGKAQGNAWTFLPVDVGMAQGFFAGQGLDIEVTDLGGDAKIQQALVAGSIDIGLGSGPGMAFLAKGSPSQLPLLPVHRATLLRSCLRIRRSRQLLT